MVMGDGTPVSIAWAVYHGDVCLVWVRISVEFCSNDAGGHCRNGDLFGGTNGIHFFVGELDLPGVHIVDQFVAVHEVDADNVVVQLVDDVHQMSELLRFDIKVYFIDPQWNSLCLRKRRRSSVRWQFSLASGFQMQR